MHGISGLDSEKSDTVHKNKDAFLINRIYVSVNV
jgi:hypothetical protein